MKLRIEETFWGINHRDGGYSEKVTADVTFPCQVGPIPEFGNGRRHFSIDAVTEKTIVLSVHYENNPSADEKWRIRVGCKKDYAPRSFDGGHKYRFYVTE